MMKMKYTVEGFDRDKLLLHETLFHNANGYLGVRSCFEEGYPEGTDSIRGMYINGVYNTVDMPQPEAFFGFATEKEVLVNIADPQSIDLMLGKENLCVFCDLCGEIISFKRELDMDAGTAARRVHWRSKKGKEIILTVTRMASFARRSLFTIEYAVTSVNFTGELRLTSGHTHQVTNHGSPGDPRVADKPLGHWGRSVNYISEPERGSTAVSTASRSGITVCTAVRHKVNGLYWDGHDFTAQMKPGMTVTLEKYVVASDSRRGSRPMIRADNEMKKVLSRPLPEHYKAQKAFLTKFWKTAAVTIEGDAEAESFNLAMRYNLYQLLQSAPADSLCGMAAKGLSGEGYEGHCFWDGEMFAFPPLLLTQPETALTMLRFRHGTLPKARENARLLGHKNSALFPWRTISGAESSGYFPAGTAQYHINGDIAYAVVQYYFATGDMDFMRKAGLELLLEICRLWLDLGHYHNGRFVINGVTGPDEYTCMVNNNYYTNALAKHNLSWTVHIARKMGYTHPELEDFKRAAEAMYLPYDAVLGINPQDDSFLQKPLWDIDGTPESRFPLLLHYHPMQLFRHQVCKQADVVMSHFILEEYADKDAIEKSFLYYEKITTHDSSLSKPIFCAVAARLGLMDKALSYFRDSVSLDLNDTHSNSADGIHTANSGGAYIALIYGFAGLRLTEDGVSFTPHLPEGWNRLSFTVIHKGKTIPVRIERDGEGYQVSMG
ncbi:MAG: family 65 glycosyl hydrolase [Clostridiales bacterium]|jgi:alpha,alpha-trehalose phosphorylase|nr:family 65 glycosyl hydrolase [Clostridiales bacterium]